jgi:transposase
MWTTANRPKYNRDKLRYPSDLTDEEWAHIAPLIPPAKHGGRKRKVDVREVVNGDYVRIEHGVPMALCAQGPAAEEHAL